jgi:predicted TIM-barrel enzyme
VVTPVIHVLDTAQTLANLAHVEAAGCPGAFLINHDFGVEPFLPILREVRAARPGLWLGVNFLAQPGSAAFPILGQLAAEGCAFQAYWADDARIDERTEAQPEAEEIARIRADSGWEGLYFGGVAFKKQRPVAEADYAEAARRAAPFVDVVTTSGIATGQEADLAKIETFRAALGAAPLALASGITPENAARYAGSVNCFLVATGINRPGDFYTIDPARLDALLAVARAQGEPA